MKREKRKVTVDEMNAFLKAYPNQLVQDVALMYEPPLLTFNDFTDGSVWPESVVVSVILNSKSCDPTIPDVCYIWEDIT